MTESIVILAAGVSSRMKRSLADLVDEQTAREADTRTKGMISVGSGGRPLLDYLLYNIYRAGYKRVYFVVGSDNALIRSQYGLEDADNNFHGLSISYAVQSIPEGRSKPLGTADAVFQALVQYPELQSEEFSVCNSDNLYSEKALRVIRCSAQQNAWINYDRNGMDFPLERINAFAITVVNESHQLCNIIEKPTPDQIAESADPEGIIRVSMNLFKFSGSMFFQYLENCPLNSIRQEKELPTALLNMANDHREDVVGISISEHVPDLTEKADIKTVQDYLDREYGDLSWNQPV